MSYLCIIVIISKKNSVGKGLKIVRYKTFIKKLNQALHQSLKRKEKKREEIVESVENVEDVEKVENVENVEDYTIPLPVEDVEKFVNQFTKRLRIDGV